MDLFDNQDEDLRPIAAQTASQQHEQQPVPAKENAGERW